MNRDRIAQSPGKRIIQAAPWLALWSCGLCATGALAQNAPAAPAAAQDADNGAGAAASPDQTTAPEAGALQEVVVTAARREEDIQRVPISVQAITQGQMDVEGIKEFTDVVKYTPGLNVATSQGGGNQVTIRGIASSAGAATTGIYIDDTPIQVRNSGYNPGTAFPSLFDLQRVEVLRGPQGTLFGAGSEGGTVRFILAQPSLTKFTTYARAEGNGIQNGGLGDEAGLSLSGPIVSDRLGFLVSAYYRKEAGYIDAVTGTYSIVDPTGALKANSVDFTKQGDPYPNANWDATKGYRVALRFAPTQDLTITPSLIYQDRYWNQSDDAFFPAASNPSAGEFNYYASYAGNPATDPRLMPQYGPNLEQAEDRFALTDLSLQWDLGPVQLSYNGSYFNRDQYGWRDYTELYEYLYGPPVQLPGDHSNGYLPNSQRNLVQELRFQSTDANARFSWVAGVFYSRNKQDSNDIIGTNFLASTSPFTLGFGNPGLANGPPFGPGSTGIENYFGYPLMQPGSISFTDIFNTIDTQIAVFAQDDFKITPKLTLTTGLRYSHFGLSLNSIYGGAENNLFPTYGATCASLGYTTCVPGVTPPGQFAVTDVSNSGSAVTPKISLAYQLTQTDMFYASIAKGFRPAGADLQVPVASCAGDLTTIGYPPNGNQTTQPAVYKPDYVWSYEVGAKDGFFDNRGLIDASVYQILWSDIQTDVPLPCAYDITLNAGHATSEGLDLNLQGNPIQNLQLGGTFGYNKATFSENSLTPSGEVLFYKGTGIPGAGSPLTYSVQANYEFNLGQNHQMYIHGDWSDNSRPRRAGQTSPLSPNYQPLTVTPDAYSVTNLRVGSHFFGDTVDVSAFVNNTLNTHPWTSLNYSYNTYYWLGSTIQPRTFGLTVVYRR